MSTRSRRAPGSPPDRCTCSTPSAAASLNTRAQVAASSSSSRRSSAIGLEQYGQPSGQRCVSSASKPKGLVSGLAPATLQLQQLLLREPRQQLGHVGIDALARRVERLGEVIDDRGVGRLAGATLEDLYRDRVGLEDALGRQQHPAALRLAVGQADTARQARFGFRRYAVTVTHLASSQSGSRSLRSLHWCYTTSAEQRTPHCKGETYASGNGILAHRRRRDDLG